MSYKTAFIQSILLLGTALGTISVGAIAQETHVEVYTKMHSEARSEMQAEMQRSASGHADKTTGKTTGQFQRIEQPLWAKIAVTAGGVGLVGLELWWFLLSKPRVSHAAAQNGGDE